MTEIFLPTVNFDSTPGYNEFRFLHEIYSREFFIRSLIAANPGIVDRTGDPTTGTLDTSRPLFVSANAANPLTLDVTPGYAITPNHRLIVVDGNLSAIPLPEVVANRTYVVGLEYKLVASSETRENHFGNVAEVRLERPSSEPFGNEASTLTNTLFVVNINDYFNASLFPDERKQYTVIIAVVIVRSDAATSELSLEIDLTRTLFDFNRPWFSTEDTTHRLQVGSGLATESNPHATGIVDLTSANLTLYQQLMPKGGVFSKDSKYFGYPGVFCQELVSLNRYQIDDQGEITAEDDLELPPLRGRYFVTLTKVPVRVGSLYFEGEPWNPIPYYWKPGTRFLILATLEEPLSYGKSLIFEYFAVSALMPPSESITQGVQTFEVTAPEIGQDYIVSGGLAINELATPSLSLTALCGPIKKAYRVLCDRDGSLILDPQPLVSSLRFSDLVSFGTISINQTPLNGFAVRLTIGLTRAVESLSALPGFELNIKIRLTGRDETDSVVTEDIVFKASQWKEQGTANVEEPLQFRQTKNKFSSLTSIQRLNTTSDPDNAGSDAILTVWANILEASEVQEVAGVASFFWTGTTGIRVRDQRVVATSTQRADQRQARFPLLLPENDAAFVQEFFSVLLDPPLTDALNHSKRLALELDDDRYISETWETFSSVDATATIEVTSFSIVTPGTTIRLETGKALNFQLTGVDPDVGEVQIPISLLTGDAEIKNNIVNTVNNPSFDSTWFAEAGNSDVTLTRSAAYIDGFVTNVRKKMKFDSPFTAGMIDFTVNGTPIATVTSTGTHDSSLDLIVAAVNLLTPTTGVNAVAVTDSPTKSIIFNGNIDGDDFTIAGVTFTGAVNSVTFSILSDPFIYTQPAGGSLSTTHLPNRFTSEEVDWHYQSVAIPWKEVKLRAEISFAGDVATNVQNLDQVELTPGKILIARRGSPSPSINRSIGEFLVTTTSLVDTLQSMVDTINHPDFDSGLEASLNLANDTVLVEIGGYGGANMTLLQESVTGTWNIQNYTSVGGGADAAHGFLKSIYPLSEAQWRYQTTDDVGTWSAWFDMDSVSNSAFKFSLVGGLSLYCIQVRLTGPRGKPNGFSLYQVSPQTNNTTGLEPRIEDLEDELDLARGTFPPITGLDSRISVVVDAAGNRVQDPEVTEGRNSTVLYPQATLKERLDVAEGLSYWQHGLNDNHTNPVEMGHRGVPNQLVSGLVDGQGNSNFLASASSILTIQALPSNPLILTLHGNYYRHARDFQLDFASLPASLTPYYIFAEVRVVSKTFAPGDVTVLSDTISITAGHELRVGDHVRFTSTGTLPAGLTAGVTYYVSATPSTTVFEVSATYGGSTLDITSQGSGTHTVTLINQELGQTVFAGYTTAAAAAGDNVLEATGLTAASATIDSMLGTQRTPLVVHIPTVLAGGSEVFFSPVVDTPATDQIEMAGQLPTAVASGTYFEVRSFREASFTVSTTRSETSKKLAIGQVIWNGLLLSQVRPYRYLDQYKSTIVGPILVPGVGSMTPQVFDHNLGKIPRSFTLLYHSVITGDAQPTVIQTELIAKVDETTLTVVNRYDGTLARVFGTPPSAVASGFLQLLI